MSSKIPDLPPIDFKKPRCRACGGECASVCVSYPGRPASIEWECLKCHKSYPTGQTVGKKSYRKRV